MKRKIILILFLGCITLAVFLLLTDKNDSLWDFTTHNGEEAKWGKNNHYSSLGYYDPVVKTNYRLITFLDKVSGKSTILCDQANCNHTSDTCPAYLSDSVTTLFCYNGSIFYFLRDSKMSWQFYRMDEDGHNKRRLMEICNMNEAHSAQIIGIDRDILYYTTHSSGKEIIYKLDMKTMEKVTILDIDTSKVYRGRWEFTEDNLYFSEYSNSAELKNCKIYNFDLHSYEMKTVYDGEFLNSYTIYNDNMIIATETGVKKIDMTTQKIDTLFEELKLPQVTSDENYLYVDNIQVNSKEKIPRTLQVFDKQMKVVNKIDLPDTKDYLHNYVDTILFMANKGTYEYLLKADILKPDAAFVKSTSVK